VLVDSAPGRRFAGKVLFSIHQADNVNNTLQVKVRIEDPDARLLRPEMIARVRFTAPPGSGGGPAREAARLLVPKDAVEKFDGGSAVWVVDGDKTARRRAVVLGAGRQGDLVEVVSGLSALDRVIVGGKDGLVDGERVRVAETD
jgi:multidrug efflux pump subunit AcrA (membrane-fusion protein)